MVKRKSDVAEIGDYEDELQQPNRKAARKSDASTASSSSSTRSWKDIQLEGDDEGEVPVYDTPGEVRRKIRLLLKEPSFKVTPWLKEIGNINSNSYRRFMAEKDAQSGKGNGTYYAAYVYFEKRRILDGKAKTPTRVANEKMAGGFELRDRKGMWVLSR
ncbi:hypothetical protein MIND_00378600 [Mycena indigotica]|uniref:DUF7726 domain-containing protein n=1 Tax=Mycena indigotica TaxID=2126181 RepID=A0A8H6T2W7_9AGAR|nr:uncharacterized protein MIND_00378600 [Mycena indigotica]KAF7310056.1 hypothetical protein MIND_00378600 [Mycena indigotica]